MKKISLRSVKEFLSRDEMRKISGGSGPGGSGGARCGFNCQGDYDCPSICGCNGIVGGWGICYGVG